MAPLPPPQGMSEADYETIEAAVTETVRGRWFLGEFARRNRTAELRQVLDAMARIETVVTAGQPALPPPADPSIRLLMQRVKEIAGQLESLSAEMDAAGVDPRFRDAIDHQARAVAGMMRGPGRGAVASPPPAPPRVEAPTTRSVAPPAPATQASPAHVSPAHASPAHVSFGHALSARALSGHTPAWPAPSHRPSAEMPPAYTSPADLLPPADLPEARPLPRATGIAPDDPRIAALSALDGLVLAKKLSLFS